MKFVFVTDLHFGRAPSQRLDDYHASLLSKLQRVVDFANKQSCYAILLGGDLFDIPRVAPHVLLDLRDLFVQFHGTILFVVGEHDTMGHARETLRNCSISLLQKMLSNFVMLDSDYIFLEGKQQCHIYGLHCWDKPATRELLKENRADIFIVHSLITPNEMPFATFPVSTLSLSAPLVLSGDFHHRFDVIGPNGTRFVNPGPFARRKDTDDVPNIAFMDFSPKSINVKLLPIRCDMAQWSEKPIEESPSNGDVNLSEFADRLKNFQWAAGDIYELVERMAESEGVEAEVVNLIRSQKS